MGGGWLGASPACRVLAPAGAATTEQREQQAEEQREQRARAHHTFALIGLCGEQRLSAGSPHFIPWPDVLHPLTQVAGTGDRVA